MTLKELKTEIAKLERLFIDTNQLTTEYYKKIAWSFSPLIFTLVGFPLSVIINRREKSANVVLAILCSAFYYLITLGCEALSKKGILPPALIMWTPNMIAGMGAVILNFKCVL